MEGPRAKESFARYPRLVALGIDADIDNIAPVKSSIEHLWAIPQSIELLRIEGGPDVYLKQILDALASEEPAWLPELAILRILVRLYREDHTADELNAFEETLQTFNEALDDHGISGGATAQYFEDLLVRPALAARSVCSRTTGGRTLIGRLSATKGALPRRRGSLSCTGELLTRGRGLRRAYGGFESDGHRTAREPQLCPRSRAACTYLYAPSAELR